MKYIIIGLMLVGILLFGCIGAKKDCGKNRNCFEAALKNNCEQATYEADAFGRLIKKEITNEGSSCKVTDGLYEKSGKKLRVETCYYPMPITESDKPTCDTWDYRIDS
jgi:hypothetical protein